MKALIFITVLIIACGSNPVKLEDEPDNEPTIARSCDSCHNPHYYDLGDIEYNYEVEE